MPQNKQFSQKPKIKQASKDKQSIIIILIVIILSILIVCFGAWLYTATFLLPPKTPEPDPLQKRLQVNAKQYQDVIISLQNDQKYQAPKIDKNPFK